MRTQPRPRTYVARFWIVLVRPVLRYSQARDAFVLRVVGNSTGPVLRVDRRRRRKADYKGIERRHVRLAAVPAARS